MDFTRLSNKRGYFFDGTTLLVGYIGGNDSVYCKFLSGRVIYSKPLYCGFRAWNIGYSYSNWDWSDFEFLPAHAFHGLYGYLKFLDEANYEEIKAFFKLQKLMETEDFKQFELSL